MKLNGKTLQILNSGWFENGKRAWNMKNDQIFKRFTYQEIFRDLTNVK